jgi:rubrerythrin
MPDRLVVLVDAQRPTAFSGAPLTRWRCLRCGDWFLTRDAAPICPLCGFREDGS